MNGVSVASDEICAIVVMIRPDHCVVHTVDFETRLLQYSCIGLALEDCLETAISGECGGLHDHGDVVI